MNHGETAGMAAKERKERKGGKAFALRSMHCNPSASRISDKIPSSPFYGKDRKSGE